MDDVSFGWLVVGFLISLVVGIWITVTGFLIGWAKRLNDKGCGHE